jgi:predicted nucleic acid-binding protein
MTKHERGVLDTSVIIDLPEVSLAGIVQAVSISAITVAELAAGPHASKDPAVRAVRQQRLQWVENTFEVVPFDIDAARYYGHMYALVLAAGHSPRGRLADLMIAATAAANGLPLLTRNPKDFVGLDSIVRVVAA